MKNRMKWTRSGLAGILAVSLLVTPQIAAANDRYATPRYYDSGYQTYAYPTADRGYGYGDANGYHGDYGSRDYYTYDDYGHHRSRGRSGAIIGGSAAAGAAFGALAGGGKGAAIGATLGGIGGLIYDHATKHAGRYRDR